MLQNHIQAGNGFAVVDVSSYGDLEDEQRHQLTRSLARAFGNYVIHHSAHLKQDLVTDIRDKGFRFTSAQNQSINNSIQEAVEHTESSELEEPIRMFMLSCIYLADGVGANKLVNPYTLVQRMKMQHLEYVERLTQPYVFDTARGEKMITPIQSVEGNGNLHFRWMRAFLENGKSQTTHWDETTDKMIGWISEEIKSLRIRVQLARGDIGSFNNRASMHVRDSYENHPDYEPCWLLRS